MKVLNSKKLRSAVVALDSRFAHAFFRNKYYFYLSAKSLKTPFTHRLIISHNHKTSTLHELFFKYGSDKGAPNDQSHPNTLMPAHTYADLYFMLFDFSRGSVKRVFECGLGTNDLGVNSNMGLGGMPGASLRAWRDYFPNAEIFGADIDSHIIFSEDRIKTFYVDQTNQNSIENMWNQISVENFDIVIDDGLHTFDAGKSLFQSSISKVREGGVYIIEDINPEDKDKFFEYFKKQPYRFLIVDLHRPNTWLSDNSVAVIWK